MYIWILNYGYMICIVGFFFLSPFLSFKIDKNLFKDKNIYRIFGINMVLFSIIVIILLYLKSKHLYAIANICFDYPIIAYKDNIPQECYTFNMEKYHGVGWTLTAILWIFFEFIYLGIIYISWIIKKKIQNSKGW